MSEKACHSPYSQNGAQKSPLEIPRFPFYAAFSHKELMVPFLTSRHVYCQNDEVSPECTRRMSREVVVRYPHDVRRQAASGHRSSSDSARYSHRHGFVLETRHILGPRRLRYEACGRSILRSIMVVLRSIMVILRSIFSKTGPELSKTQ